jgi:hypothetical protein
MGSGAVTSLPEHALLSTLAMQVSSRSQSDQRINDTTRATPHLTRVARQPSQLSLTPLDNAGQVRRPRSEKATFRARAERAARANDEPHFNTGVARSPRRGRHASPGARSRRQGQGTLDRRQNGIDGGSVLSLFESALIQSCYL